MSKYSDDKLRQAVSGSTTYIEVIRKLGLWEGGGTYRTLQRRITKAKIDVSHFTRIHGVYEVSSRKKHWSETLINRQGGFRRQHGYILRRALVESGRPYLCADCGINGCWNNKILTLQVDHIDNDWLNDTKENLEFRCPNCHSQKTMERRISINRCKDCNKQIRRSSTWCLDCAKIHMVRHRKVKNRPEKSLLVEEVRNSGYSATGRKYGVTDNTIRKWMKSSKLS